MNVIWGIIIVAMLPAYFLYHKLRGTYKERRPMYSDEVKSMRGE